MEHRWFPHNKNKEVQNSYLFYFVNFHPHHVVALVYSSVEAIQHVLPLNVLLINESQAMIATHAYDMLMPTILVNCTGVARSNFWSVTIMHATQINFGWTMISFGEIHNS
jgi:hypothetical protein